MWQVAIPSCQGISDYETLQNNVRVVVFMEFSSFMTYFGKLGSKGSLERTLQSLVERN